MIELSDYQPTSDLSRASTLPARWYVDPEMLALENNKIFGRTWQAVGQARKVANPGDYFACEVVGEPLVVKHYPNSFRETNLLDLLKGWGIERVIITGMMTHMCVDATARAAADFGFQVIVAEDACATRDLKYGDTTIPADHVHKAFLAALKSYGQVMTSEQVIAHLGAEQAKAI